MTRDHYIQIIRSACIAVNPEIVELKFGCEVMVGELKHTVYEVEEDTYSACMIFEGEWVDVEIGKDRKKNIEILGREIQLSDVLLAIPILWMQPKNKRDDDFRYISDGMYSTGFKWNLREPLSNQSLPTLQFISELVK